MSISRVVQPLPILQYMVVISLPDPSMSLWCNDTIIGFLFNHNKLSKHVPGMCAEEQLLIELVNNR